MSTVHWKDLWGMIVWLSKLRWKRCSCWKRWKRMTLALVLTVEQPVDCQTFIFHVACAPGCPSLSMFCTSYGRVHSASLAMKKGLHWSWTLIFYFLNRICKYAHLINKSKTFLSFMVGEIWYTLNSCGSIGKRLPMKARFILWVIVIVELIKSHICWRQPF